MKTILGLISLALTIQIAPAVQFVNGGFEDPQTFFKILYTGETIPGWRVVGGSVEVLGFGLWQPSEGNMSMDTVGVNVRGAIAQDITFDGAGDYHVDFSLSRNPNINYSVARLGVWYKPPSATDYLGLGLFEYGKVNSEANMMWRSTGTGTFAAEAGVTTFIFASLTGGGSTTDTWGGPALDDIRLIAGGSPYTPVAPPNFATPEALLGHYGVYDNVPPGGGGIPPGGGGATVPDGGTTVALLVIGLVGIGSLRRWRANGAFVE